MKDWRDGFLMLALAATTLVGCATLQSIDPVERPPAKFQQGRPVTVEFLAPELVTLRCLQRGSIVPANACSDTQAITITNPCSVTNQSYAVRLCHELAHTNGWRDGLFAQNGEPIPPPAFTSPEAMAVR